jgi:hypothetical protein
MADKLKCFGRQSIASYEMVSVILLLPVVMLPTASIIGDSFLQFPQSANSLEVVEVSLTFALSVLTMIF